MLWSIVGDDSALCCSLIVYTFPLHLCIINSIMSSDDTTTTPSTDINSDYTVPKQTPVLFCTDRGIHLRQTTTEDEETTTSTAAASSTARHHHHNKYHIQHCDLTLLRPNSTTSPNRVMEIGLTPNLAGITSRRSSTKMYNKPVPPTVLVRQKRVRFQSD